MFENDPHDRFMQLAIRLSRRGYPAPNPHVGCVIVRDGEVVGTGWHEYTGGPHAEVVALLRAGNRAQGADAYVTLEPCNHFGRTAPCSEALIRAGIRRVIIAHRDPNPKAAGGIERLKEAGVDIVVGVQAQAAEAANVVWLTAMKRRRPYVALKAAITLDGRMATPEGQSRWVTGVRARTQGQRFRAELGSVLVGRRTVELDNPLLTARFPGVHNQPTAILLDPQGKLDGELQVLAADRTVLHVLATGIQSKLQGATALHVESGHDGIDLQSLMAALFERGIVGVLIEGGSFTLTKMLSAQLVDRIDLFVAPKVLGEGPSWIEGASDFFGLERSNYMLDRVRRIDGDIWLRYVVSS